MLEPKYWQGRVEFTDGDVLDYKPFGSPRRTNAAVLLGISTMFQLLEMEYPEIALAIEPLAQSLAQDLNMADIDIDLVREADEVNSLLISLGMEG